MKRLAINWSNSDTVEVVDDPHGPFVRAKEAEAEVARIKAENERLRAGLQQIHANGDTAWPIDTRALLDDEEDGGGA
jgi:hypothetical protein